MKNYPIMFPRNKFHNEGSKWDRRHYPIKLGIYIKKSKHMFNSDMSPREMDGIVWKFTPLLGRIGNSPFNPGTFIGRRGI